MLEKEGQQVPEKQEKAETRPTETYEERRQRIQQRKRDRKLEQEQKRIEEEKQREEKAKVRQKHKKQMSKYTKKGQPLMSGRINRLLDKIKESDK